MSMLVESPAIGEEFLDRENEIRQIMEYVRRGEHIILIGHRKVGKTSILFKIGEEFSKEGVFFIYLYIPESPNVELIANEFLRSVLKSLSDLPLTVDIKDAVRIIAKKFPKIASETLSLVELNKDESIFRDALLLLDQMLNKLGRKAILVLDEFQNIANASLAFLDYLRQSMWSIRRITIILCGSMIRMIDRILSRPSMPQGLKRIKIEPFDYPTAKDFMINLSKKAISEPIMALIYAMTGGMPFHIKVIMKELNSLGVEKISWWAVRRAILEELMSDSGVLYNYYSAMEEKLTSLSALYLEILYAIATGHRRLSDIANFLNKSPQEVNYYIRRLREMEVIDNDNVIIDEMFELWLETAWPILRKAPIPELKRRRELFLQAIDRIIEQYKSTLGQAIEIIMYELVKKMHGEVIEREPMPNPKQVIKNATINDEEIDILAIRNNEAWVIEVTTSPITKGDIVKLEEKSHLLSGYKKIHKILVATSTISHEALQLALQLGIRIWTKHKMRKIFRYYKILIPPQFF